MQKSKPGIQPLGDHNPSRTKACANIRRVASASLLRVAASKSSDAARSSRVIVKAFSTKSHPLLDAAEGMLDDLAPPIENSRKRQYGTWRALKLLPCGV
jgi:hypothetical protein